MIKKENIRILIIRFTIIVSFIYLIIAIYNGNLEHILLNVITSLLTIYVIEIIFIIIELLKNKRIHKKMKGGKRIWRRVT